MRRPLRYPRDVTWWAMQLAALLINNPVLKWADAHVCRWANVAHLPRWIGD